jgi:hypothetical protein
VADLGALDRRQDDLLAGVQVGVGMLDARDFLAGDRVAGTKEPTLSRSTRRAASTTSRLVEPTSMISMLA